MADWVLKGLRTGIKTTAYPERAERAAGVSPGRPIGTALGSAKGAEKLAELCPTGAITSEDRGVTVDFGRCVHCYRCHPGEGDEAVNWDLSYEWAAERDELVAAKRKLDKAFGRSLQPSFRRCGRLRGVRERGAAAQQSLLQHASAGLLHDADAAQRRCPARCRPGVRCDADPVAANLRGDAGTKAGRGHRGLRSLWWRVRSEFRRVGRCLRDAPD